MRSLIISIVLLLNLNSFSFASNMVESAKYYKPTIESILLNYWSAMPNPIIIYGEVEQESGWKKNATLHTSRELGRGLGQITIAYDKNGKERFNNYRNAIRMAPLKKWDWQRDPYNERFQLTYLVLQLKSNYSVVSKYMKNSEESIKCMLICYNAGEGRWLSRRRNAKLKGFDATSWTNGLDKAYTSGEETLLYGRPLWVAVNEYPVVIFKKSEKYKELIK